jgi:Ras-related protein Rab-8A
MKSEGSSVKAELAVGEGTLDAEKQDAKALPEASDAKVADVSVAPAAKTPLGYDFLVKLLLVGDSGVGKSGLVLRFADGAFNPDFTSTIGIDFKLRTCDLDSKKIKFQVLDPSGQERFRTITTAHFRNAMGILFVFDVTKEDSFLSIPGWLKTFTDHRDLTHFDLRSRVLLVGSKCDLENQRVISTEQVPPSPLPLSLKAWLQLPVIRRVT